MVSLPSYDNNEFAQGISTAEYRKLLRDPARPMLNVAIGEQYPPGSTYKLVTGSGALQDGKIDAHHDHQDRALHRDRQVEVLGLEQGRLRPGEHLRWLRALERHLLLPPGGHARHRPAGLLGARMGLRQAAPASTCRARWPGSCPRTTGSGARSTRSTSPARSTRPASARATTPAAPSRSSTPTPPSPTAARSTSRSWSRRILDPEGNVVERIEPEVIRQLDIDKSILRTMRVAARRVVTRAPHLQPRGPAHRRGRQVGHGRVRHPRPPGPPALQQLVRRVRAQGSAQDGLRSGRPRSRSPRGLPTSSCSPTCTTRERPATPRPRSSKYFLQLHYGLLGRPAPALGPRARQLLRLG